MLTFLTAVFLLAYQDVPTVKKAFPFDDIFIETKSLQLDGSSSDMLLGDVGRIAFIGDFVVVLERDEQPRVLVFNRHTGAFVQQLGRVGQGPGEYLNASSIATTDDYVFLLDSMASVITIFNKDLSMKTAFRIADWTQNHLRNASNIAGVVGRDLLLWFTQTPTESEHMAAMVTPGGKVSTFVAKSAALEKLSMIGGGILHKNHQLYVVQPTEPRILIHDSQTLDQKAEIGFGKPTWPLITEEGFLEASRNGLQTQAFRQYLSGHLSSHSISAIHDWLIVDYAAVIILHHEQRSETLPIQWKYPSGIVANPEHQIVYADQQETHGNVKLVFYGLKPNLL